MFPDRVRGLTLEHGLSHGSFGRDDYHALLACYFTDVHSPYAACPRRWFDTVRHRPSHLLVSDLGVLGRRRAHRVHESVQPYYSSAGTIVASLHGWFLPPHPATRHVRAQSR